MFFYFVALFFFTKFWVFGTFRSIEHITEKLFSIHILYIDKFWGFKYKGITKKTLLIKYRRFGSKPTSENLLLIVNNSYSVFNSAIKIDTFDTKKHKKIGVFRICEHY